MISLLLPLLLEGTLLHAVVVNMLVRLEFDWTKTRATREKDERKQTGDNNQVRFFKYIMKLNNVSFICFNFLKYAHQICLGIKSRH